MLFKNKSLFEPSSAICLPVIFLLGSILTTATGFRFGNLPVGVGELMCVLALCVISFQFRASISGGSISKLLWIFCLFWVLIAVLMALGAGVSIHNSYFRIGPGLHDSLAYIFVALFSISIGYYLQINSNATGIIRLLLFYIVFASVPLFFLWLMGRFIAWSSFEWVWYNTRFLGWAKNPNQIAMLLAPIPFISLKIIFSETAPKIRFLAVIILFISTTIGMAAASTGLTLTWLVVGIPVILLLLYKYPKHRILLLLFVLFFCGQYIYPHFMFPEQQYRLTLYRRWVDPNIDAKTFQKKYYEAISGNSELGMDNSINKLLTADSGYDYFTTHLQGDNPVVHKINSNHSNTRLMLFKNAVKAISFSPIVGLGPGAYSGINEPFEGWEAHNSLLDLTMSAGVIGGGAALALFSWLFFRLMFAGLIFNAFTLLSLCSIAMFHHVLRHPSFWIVVVLCSFESISEKNKSLGDESDRLKAAT